MTDYTQDGHIRLANLEAFAWTMTALTILLSAGRYAISATSKQKLQWDGFTHLLALLMMVTMTALFQSLFHDGYYITAIERKLIPMPSQESFVELYVRFRRRVLAIVLLFFTSTWLVKLTFLLFYRNIFQVNRNFRKAWWAVLVFVFITYWVTVTAALTQCGPVQNSFSLVECVKPDHLLSGVQGLKYACAVSVATDVAIMALPLWMLKGLQMRLSQKVGLAIMFSLGIIIIIFEIIRTIKSLQLSSFSEVAIFDIAESCVALIVSSMTNYRYLLSTRRRQQTEKRHLNLRVSSSSGERGNNHRLQIIRGSNNSDTSGEEHDLSFPDSQNREGYPNISVGVPEDIHV